MNFSILIILIVCALSLYSVKYLNELYQNGILKIKLEEAARKALRFTLMGIAFVGLAWLALCLFPIVRFLGFTLFSPKLIEAIRQLLDVVLDTRSVYIAIQLIGSTTLLVVEISLLFSVFGFIVTKTLVFPYIRQCSYTNEEIERQDCVEVAIPRKERKIFLNFANLRI